MGFKLFGRLILAKNKSGYFLASPAQEVRSRARPLLGVLPVGFNLGGKPPFWGEGERGGWLKNCRGARLTQVLGFVSIYRGAILGTIF